MEYFYAIGWRLFVAGVVTWLYMWVITTFLWCKNDDGCIAIDAVVVLIGSIAWATNRGAKAADKMRAAVQRQSEL